MSFSHLDDAIKDALDTLKPFSLGNKVHDTLANCPLSSMIKEKLELSWQDREIHGAELGPIDGVVVIVQTFPCSVEDARAYFQRGYGGFVKSLDNRNKGFAEELARKSGKLECVAICFVCSPSQDNFRVFLSVIPEDLSVSRILPADLIEGENSSSEIKGSAPTDEKVVNESTSRGIKMKWFKKLFKGNTTKHSTSMPDSENNKNRVNFVHKQNEGKSTYEIYSAQNAEKAKEFLLTKKVTTQNYYILVETPEGNWGMDKLGLYLERLLPFQKDVKSAHYIGRICNMPDMVAVELAAKGLNESYIVNVECGNCNTNWQDAVRYQNSTVVCCPKCKGLNKIDTSDIQVLFVDNNSWPVFQKFLSGLDSEERSRAEAVFNGVNGHMEVLALYDSDSSFSAALDFAKKLPDNCHPIATKFKDGGGLYVRGTFPTPEGYKYFLQNIKENCNMLITE